MMVCDSAPMLLRRSRSELDPNRRSYQSARSRIFDDTKSHHSTLDSIYSKNSIIQKDGDFERNSCNGRSHKTKSIYSNVKRCRSEADAGPKHGNICGDNDNRSLCSFHSVKSVFQRAQDNYQTIIGSNYPLSKVTSIWKALSEFIEQQLKTDKATVIPKLGVFTIIETNLQGHTHKKPVFITNKTLLKMHDLKSKEYGVTKAVQRSVVSYLDISNKCSLNRFVVEEVISEVIKSFEKLLMTKRNCELPFFQIGKLQVQAGEIRMKFYEDFIKTLNRSLFRSQSCCSLISGISKLSRTSSAFSKMTSLSECYRPTSEFHCVLPLTTKGTGAEKPERSATDCLPQMRKSQSLESRRTKDTQSLLSIPSGSSCSCSKRSCCLQQATREAHGDACLCIVCESRQRGVAPNNIGDLILQGNCEVERRKNILIDGTSKVKEIESRQRLEVEKTSKQMQEDAARYNRELAVKWDGRRPKRSTASRADNDLMFRRPNSECERRKNKISNVNEIIAQIKQKKSQEKCQKLKEEQSMKERNDKLTQLLYEERVKNIKEKNCKRDQMKQGLDDQLEDKRNKPKDPSVVNFDSQLLCKTPLRNDMSSFSQLQIQKGRYKTQGDLASGLRLLSMRVDTHVINGSGTTLECVYDLESEVLYSVKWYKDGNEFYRYIPNDQPQTLIYPLPGVHIDRDNSNSSHICLTNVSLSSSGIYRCEVSAEGPSFQTVTDHGNLVAVALPDKGPTITGGRARYTEGDRLGVNCTSGASKPATQLTWFINGEPVNSSSSIIRGPWREYLGREGLETTTLGLVFKVNRRHFRRGDLKVKCVATIASIYWKSNEESSEAERQQRQHPAEVKFSDSAVSSRADQVKGSSARPHPPAYLMATTAMLVSAGLLPLLIR